MNLEKINCDGVDRVHLVHESGHCVGSSEHGNKGSQGTSPCSFIVCSSLK